MATKPKTRTTPSHLDAARVIAEEIARRLDEKSDLVFQKFMEQAKGIIFDPPQPQVQPAEASSSGGSIFSPWGAGVALKYRRDTTRRKPAGVRRFPSTAR